MFGDFLAPCCSTIVDCRCCLKLRSLFDELRFEAERTVKALVTSAVVLPAAELEDDQRHSSAVSGAKLKSKLPWMPA